MGIPEHIRRGMLEATKQDAADHAELTHLRDEMDHVQREYFRRQVDQYGLNVHCIAPRCSWRGKHRAEDEGRLAYRRCPACGLRSVHSSSWAARFPERVRKLVAEHLAGEGVFA